MLVSSNLDKGLSLWFRKGSKRIENSLSLRELLSPMALLEFNQRGDLTTCA